MDDLEPIVDVLAFQPMPQLASALRARKERVLLRWDHLVRQLLPDADPLTQQEVRNSIPKILDQMAAALEAADTGPTDKLMEVTKNHGAARFHESYNVRELIEEYRILRRVLVEELEAARDGVVTTREWIALDTAVDIALQQAVVSFLENQRSQLISATEAEAKFLSFLAHDLRNDLNSITLTMDWVERSLAAHPSLAEQRQGLKLARQSTLNTISSMERLLQAERVRKYTGAKNDRVEVRQIVEAVAAQLRPRAQEKGLLILVEVPPSVVVLSDGGLLALIFQNLVGNAVKYSAAGTIRIWSAPLTDDSGWMIHVTDQGPGIETSIQSKLFQAFERGATHGQSGVGLGLYIAAQAARVLGTIVEVESTVGQGSTFSVRLRRGDVK